MLSFVIFDEQGPAKDPPLRHAHLLGKDELPVGGRVEFASGRVLCQKPTTEEAAFALQYPAGDAGVLTLQTCLLPDRERPYLLELELARHRIMLFLNKLEEWGLALLPTDHPAMLRFEQARGDFTAALVSPRTGSGGFTPEQARLAREALIGAIHASELLALHQAERQLHARLNPDEDARQLPPPRIGSAVHNEQFADPLKRVLATHFDFMNCPMRWKDIEPEESKFSFVGTDRWIEWAVRQGKMTVVGGPVLDFSPRSAPEWLGIWEHDYESLREFAYEHAKRVVTRYRRTVKRWVVVSGVNLNRGFSLSLDQVMELTRLSVLIVRKLHPAAKIVVELAEPYGEHASAHPQSVAPHLYAQLLLESGIQFDALGLRLQTGDRASGRSTRDLMQLSALLDSYACFEKPIDVTSLGAPSAPVPRPPGVGEPDDQDPHEPGNWRRPWTPAVQTDWLIESLTVCCSKPFVRSVCWQALYDTATNPEMPGGGLITADGKAKPALRRLYEIRAALRNRRVPTKALADAESADPGASTAEAPDGPVEPGADDPAAR